MSHQFYGAVSRLSAVLPLRWVPGGVLMLRRFSIVGSTGGCHLAVAVGGSVLC